MITLNLSCNLQQTQILQAFIYQNNLQPGDAIIVKEHDKGFVRSLLDHYLIYLGGTVFIANYRDGVKVLDCPTIFQFLPSMRVDRIRPFIGTDYDRRALVKRALYHPNRTNYHLIMNNCEHFVNEMQYGIAYSDQALIGSTVATVAGLVIINSQNKLGKIFGSILLLTGGAVATSELLRRV
jgi:hypothetical protein